MGFFGSIFVSFLLYMAGVLIVQAVESTNEYIGNRKYRKHQEELRKAGLIK